MFTGLLLLLLFVVLPIGTIIVLANSFARRVEARVYANRRDESE